MTERKASMGDKVYRGDVVKFIRDNISLGTFMKRTVKTANEACWDLCDKLNYVPAIEDKNEPHWIPVTERLPESKEEDLEYPTVLICFENEEIMLGCFYESTKEWGTGEYFDKKCDPIAWMPLPEPATSGFS